MENVFVDASLCTLAHPAPAWAHTARSPIIVLPPPHTSLCPTLPTGNSIYTNTHIHDAYIIFNIMLSDSPIFVLFQCFFRVKQTPIVWGNQEKNQSRCRHQMCRCACGFSSILYHRSLLAWWLWHQKPFVCFQSLHGLCFPEEIQYQTSFYNEILLNSDHDLLIGKNVRLQLFAQWLDINTKQWSNNHCGSSLLWTQSWCRSVFIMKDSNPFYHMQKQTGPASKVGGFPSTFPVLGTERAYLSQDGIHHGLPAATCFRSFSFARFWALQRQILGVVPGTWGVFVNCLLSD